ncbi:MAG: hypothetical protein IK033_04010 [Verrucomicrobia bacterium]|nr:hypothetical protein [Verrucomicrobiota bacterium]
MLKIIHYLKNKGIIINKNLIILLGAIVLFIILSTPLPHQLLDWYERYTLQHEKDPLKRVMLVNMSLGKNAKLWNPVYLSLPAKSDTLMERMFLADFLSERFDTNAVRELECVLEKETSEYSKSNILEIIKIIRNK